jgi:two-component system OmpR family sensor kinase
MMPTRRFVRIAFLLVVGGSVLASFFALGLTRSLGRRAADIINDMLTSVRLLGELRHEVDEQRIHIDQHIAATEPAEMARIDDELTRSQDRLIATERAYDPWAILPGERVTWERVHDELRALRAPIEGALELSRQNRDVAARRAMQAMTARFLEIESDLDELVAINDRGAAMNLAEIAGIRRQLILTLLAIGLATLVGTSLVGRWAAHQVAIREDEMNRHAKALEQRNRDLDAFAGRVAHDVRGPLTLIGLAAAQIEKKAPQLDRETEQLRRGIRRIESLTNDLLALAGVEARVLGHCDPAAVALQVREDFAARIGAEKGSLRIAVEPADVSCSEGLLRQALENLTENAVKYRRPEVPPEVDISGRATKGGYALRVSDNGVGMSAEEAGHVFDPFYRAPQTQGRPGTGLGLSIVRRVAEASGGGVSVESRPGLGSTFVFEVPLAGGSGDRYRLGAEGGSAGGQHPHRGR